MMWCQWQLVQTRMMVSQWLKGGAEVLNLSTGSFEKGSFLDAILIDTKVDNAIIPVYEDIDSELDLVQKIIMLATTANITKTWISGSSV